MNGDPRNPGSELPPGVPTEAAPRSDAGADPERDLRADLETVGAAWYALEPDQPPDPLDQAVLGAARRAVTGPRQPATWPARWPLRRPLRWVSAFATAALVLLAVTVVLEQSPEAPLKPPAADAVNEPARSPPAPQGEAAAQDAARAVPAEPRSARAPVPAAAADMEQDLAKSARAAAPLHPEAWIERLRELKAGGDSGAFQRELAAFRATYPAYPLPRELLE